MPNIGATELLIIFAIVLLVFGPSALPKIMGGVGKGIKEFRDAVRGISTDLDEDRNRSDKARRDEQDRRDRAGSGAPPDHRE
jgi:sec-independent protein translocase protein TatA